MRIVHIADPHLGYRAYHRVGRNGQNVREADVARAFDQAIEATIALEPDLVLVAGDLVHTPRPSNAVVAHAFRRIAALRAAMPFVPVIIVAGNHDSPRSADTGNLLTLFQEIPGVVAVTHASQQVYLEGLDTSVLCIPHNALAGGLRTALEPDPQAERNVLMIHGTVGGAVAEGKIRFLSEYGGEVIEDKRIQPERWDYVALGHYHLLTDLAPNMWYAGALERTSTDIWMETGPKGFLEFDTDTRDARFHPVETRPMVDLPRLDAAGLSVVEVDAHLRNAVEGVPGGIEGKLVRAVVSNIPRHAARELDHARLREYRLDALHFHLDLRPPLTVRRQDAGDATPQPGRTVRDEVIGFLSERWTPSVGGVRTGDLVKLAEHYLEPTGSEEV